MIFSSESAFLEGFLLGLGAAAPIGPINILIINEAFKGYKQAFLIGLGAMSADITYLVLIFLGMTQFFRIQFVADSISLIGGVFLLYFAYLVFKSRNQSIRKDQKLLHQKVLVAYYLKGYLLTILSPYTILFWLSVTGISLGSTSLFSTLFGLLSAITLWITFMPLIIHRSKDMFSQKIIAVLALFSSLLLASFGLRLLFKLII